MNILLDTHVLIWTAFRPERMSEPTRDLLSEPLNVLVFSAVSIWEIAIKRGLGRTDFKVEPGLFRQRLLENGFVDLPVTSAHAVAVANLPPIHKDPFDRILIAQAMTESLTLLTADAAILRYPGPIRRV